jgi:sarcosine oxidase, subunit beta
VVNEARPHREDVLVVGAGVIGSAVAYHLVRSGVSLVAVIDVDLEGELSSTELNAGGVRGTWTTSTNIAMSRRTIDFLAEHSEEVGYRPVGYTWLQTEESWPDAVRAQQMHEKSGWAVNVWDRTTLTEELPFLDKSSDLVGALFGVRDGLVNPNALKMWFRAEATRLGARFYSSTEFLSAARSGPDWKIELGTHLPLSSEQKVALLSQGQQLPLKEKYSIVAKTWVNCAGAWAPQIARRANVFCPSEPIRRQISLFSTRDLDLSPYGMIVDPGGVYFHPEATFGLSGFAVPEKSSYSFQYDGPSFFEEWIWPVLYERSTAFESLKHVTGWAGLYEVSPDHHGIVGEAVSAEGAPLSCFEAHSFSGHGVMHCFAAGEMIADMIHQRTSSWIDASLMGAKRFFSAAPRQEEKWVI